MIVGQFNSPGPHLVVGPLARRARGYCRFMAASAGCFHRPYQTRALGFAGPISTFLLAAVSPFTAAWYDTGSAAGVSRCSTAHLGVYMRIHIQIFGLF